MSTYVYGGNFEGIQSYIYGTDKLKEIVGASELLNELCSEELFDETTGLRERFGFNLKFRGKFGIVQAAASKLRMVFKEKDDCDLMMTEFPLIVRNAVPGIEFSQADEKQEIENLDTIDPDAKKNLEAKLATEKNRPSTLYYPNLMIVKRANRTGLPATGKADDEWLDAANIKKRDMADYSQEDNAHKTLTNKVLFGNDSKNINKDYREQSLFPVEIGQIANRNSFIAVVHADGNGLGNLIIQEMDKTPLKEFSKSLDNCTVNSAKDAFEEVFNKDGNWKVDKASEKKVYPFRPIILGGDDFTFVCKADDAVEFTKRFIQIFEEKTSGSDCLNRNGGRLTVCAGIAFVKEKYPMHFAYDLAESLCDLAKKEAKELKRKNNLDVIPSCFAFRKELGSFAEDFENIKDRNERFIFGPYAVSDSAFDKEGNKLLPQTDDLTKVVEVLKDNNPFKTFFRNWMSDVLVNKDSAKLLRDRFRQVAAEKYKDEYKKLVAAMSKLVPQDRDEIVLQKEDEKSPVLDILTLISVAETEKEEKGGNDDNN